MTPPRDPSSPRPVESIEPIAGEAACPSGAGCPDRETPQEAPATAYSRPAPDGTIRSGRLAGLTLWQAIFVLSWPILIESFLNSLVGLVDTMLAAGVSVAATDAIGGASYVLWFLSMIGMAIGVGATALISRSVGAGKRAVADATVGQTVLLGLVCGSAVGVLVGFLAPSLAGWLRMTGEAADALTTYLRICAFGVPAVSVFIAGMACQRGAGDTMRPLATMMIVNAVNIGVSWMLAGVDIAVRAVDEQGEVYRRVILSNPFGFDLGITGVAIGTLAAWLVGGCVALYWLSRGSSGVKLRRRRLRPHLVTMRRLVRIGLPNFIESTGMWMGNFFVLLMVGWMATPGMLGAHIVAIRIEAFSFLPGFAMGIAAATLTGQYLGAGSPAMARQAAFRCALIASLLMGTLGGLFMVFPEQVTGLFSQQPEHLALAPPLLVIAGLVQVPFALQLVLRNALSGAGDTRAVMIMTWVSTYLVRLPLAWFFCGVDIPLPEFLGGGAIANPNPWELGLTGLWIGLCAELVFRGGLFTARFLHGGWQRVRV